MSSTTMTTISILTMMIGAAIWIGVFRRLGPIETPKGMRILGAAVMVAGFLVGLSQSTPT